MIKKIVIINDFIRYYLNITGRNSAKSNQNLLSYQLTKATELEVETIFDHFNIEKFIELNKSAFNKSKHIEIWAYCYNNITKEAEKYLVSYLKDKLVIGYHLPNIIIEILIRNNISFVDTFETAYRYMQDSYLGFRTNINSAKNYLIENSLSVNTMYVYANYLKAFYNTKKGVNYLDDDSCLLVGQTSRDSVLIKKDNSFVSLEEYKDKILEIAKKYNTLYYKMHPFEPLSDSMREFLSSIPNACEENSNFYELMAQEGIKEVFGLNSGAISEAKFFSKKATFLFDRYHNYYQDEGDINDYKTFIILNSNSYIFKINFWAELLSSVISTYKVSESEEVYFDNYQSLYASFIKISSNYELNIYSIWDHKNRINSLEHKLYQQEEKINFHEFLFKKNNNRLKKTFLNILLGFIPSKKIRKLLRNKYIKN